MSLVSLQSVERRTENKARIIYEDYAYFSQRDRRLSPKGEELAEIAESLDMTGENLIAFRQWAQQTTKRCNERLAQEMTFVFALNESRDRVLHTQYLSKGEAAKLAPVVPGDLLDLDDIFRGLIVCGTHIFVSDSAVEEGLKRYGPARLLNGLFDERLAA